MASAAASPLKAGRAAKTFYEGVVEEIEQLQAARELEGLDEEIAVLRVVLRNELEKLKDDSDRLQFVTKSFDLLVKAVAARYRLSPKSRRDLSESLEDVSRELGSQLYPEGFGDGDPD